MTNYDNNNNNNNFETQISRSFERSPTNRQIMPTIDTKPSQTSQTTTTTIAHSKQQQQQQQHDKERKLIFSPNCLKLAAQFDCSKFQFRPTKPNANMLIIAKRTQHKSSASRDIINWKNYYHYHYYRRTCRSKRFTTTTTTTTTSTVILSITILLLASHLATPLTATSSTTTDYSASSVNSSSDIIVNVEQQQQQQQPHQKPINANGSLLEQQPALHDASNHNHNHNKQRPTATAEALPLIGNIKIKQDQDVASNVAISNVITIKYANVTNNKLSGARSDGADDSASGDNINSDDNETNNNNNNNKQQPLLHTFKLYEPLSVSVIESSFAHSIRLFDVSQNKLSTLSKDLFCPLSNEVRQLNISHNLLDNFDCLGLISQAGQLCLSELRVLDMSHNLIRHLPATGVATLHNLELLNLSHNQIESLDELSLSSLFKLTKLDLSHNRLTQLPVRLFHKSQSMQVLRLQSNQLQIQVTPNFLSNLISLEELDLAHNNLSLVHELAFVDKYNLTRVDLSHNQLNTLKQDALRVTIVKQAAGFRQRLLHNGQTVGLSQRQLHSQSISAEFFLAGNPFVCDCQLEWLRRLGPALQVVAGSHGAPASARSRSAQYNANRFSADQYLSDQPNVIGSSSSSSSSSNLLDSTNNLSETQQQQQQPQNGQQPQQTSSHYARVADLDLIQCEPSFKRNSQNYHYHTAGNNYHHHHTKNPHPSNPHEQHSTSSNTRYQQQQQQQQQQAGQNYGRQPVAPSDVVQQSSASTSASATTITTTTTRPNNEMVYLMATDPSSFLCRYKSHCFALCHCCEFDACDCEMICPAGCNCYYDHIWQTNIIDCSSNNHTSVPDRIPMDVSGLYLDGNHIESLRPSNLIARKQLKYLYLNSSNLQYIANRTFNGLIELQALYLHDNLLSKLNGYEFEPLAQLRALHLQSNKLEYINNKTFIYLRSLEYLDLSNNRLTSANIDLFWSIGHHNIRLKQLRIAHNWWSCQCQSIKRFRSILNELNVVDRNQLRCYYNSTTVGPLILNEPNMGQSSNALIQAYSAGSGKQQQQATILTEINQCSDMIDERQIPVQIFSNPPVISPPIMPSISIDMSNPDQALNSDGLYPPTNGNGNANFNGNSNNNNNNHNNNQQHDDPEQQSTQNDYHQPPSIYTTNSNNDVAQLDIRSGPRPSFTLTENGLIGGQSAAPAAASLPLTSLLLLFVMLLALLLIGVFLFAFIRQQRKRYSHHAHHQHHRKSSGASTTSVSSSASSTAISSLANGHTKVGTTAARLHQAHQHSALGQPNSMHHLLMAGVTLDVARGQQSSQMHRHSGNSSQSNIYAALVSSASSSVQNATKVHHTTAAPQLPAALITGAGGQQTNLYSGSSTTGGQAWIGQQAVYASNQASSVYAGIESHYNAGGGGNAISQPASCTYKTSASIYSSAMNGPKHQHQNKQDHNNNNNNNNNNNDDDDNLSPSSSSSFVADWNLGLPKVRQFMSRLVNKSLSSFGAAKYRSCSRDDMPALTSDKIYDAFISYDKRDEQFVMQQLSAELEYGQPQFRIADRFRDLPLPSSAYIAEAITSVIGCSHRTIVVVTENYLQSDWCRYELQAALREAALDRSHKIIAVVLDPKCLTQLDGEMRSLLTGNACGGSSANLASPIYQQQQQQQLVQLDGSNQSQLVATLMNLGDQNGSQQQISTQATRLATSKINFINYNDCKFWSKMKHSMPTPRPPTQTLTLTTKN